MLLEGHPDSPFVGGIFAVDIVLPRLGDWMRLATGERPVFSALHVLVTCSSCWFLTSVPHVPLGRFMLWCILAPCLLEDV